MESFSATARNWGAMFGLNTRKEKDEPQFNGPQMTAVEVPVLPTLDEYEWLHGHFTVRYIMQEVSSEDSHKPSYLVKLESRETEVITSLRLQSLENGAEALKTFQNSRVKYRAPSSEPESESEEEAQDEAEEEMVESSSPEPELNDSRPARRAKRTKFTEFFGVISSDEEKAAKSDSSDDLIVTSRSRRSGLRKKRPQYRSALDSDSDIGARAGTRTSTRQRKVMRRNLRELPEDDISEYEAVLSKHQKYVGTKEKFEKMSTSDPFRSRHRNTCEVCSIKGDHPDKGPLMFCQGCTDAYHQICLGPRTAREHLVTKVASDKFILQCRRCLGSAHTKDPNFPHQGYCTGCNKKGKMSAPLRQRLTSKQEQQLREENGGEDPITTVESYLINNENNLLFRCKACHRSFHFDHLRSSGTSSWQCHDCLSLPGEVNAMVAWRPVKTATKNMPKTPELEKEHLMKWKGKSYAHCTWMPGSWVWGYVNPVMRRAFLKSDKAQLPRMTAQEAIPDDYLRVDIVFDVKYSDDDLHVYGEDYEADLKRVHHVSQAYVKFKGLPYEDAVWEVPPGSDNTDSWNDFKAAYADWAKKPYIGTPNQNSLRKHLANVRRQKFKSKDAQPKIMTGGEIMDYQRDGLNWLYYKWFKQQNAILADEMGLGKTIQVIGLLATLIQDHKCWPFLIVVPNSTCPNWRKEFKTWVPSIRAVTYYGSSLARKLAQEHEMFIIGDPDLKCQVVITSYETMTDDFSRRVLSRIPWAGLVVDEGQRLKSDKSQIHESLSKMTFPFKVLMTGTPLQNNIRELFNLLQFCDQSQNAAELEEKYETLSKENIPELHELIRPFFLRRTKAQVLTFLPPITQIIVPATMSVLQKKLYKSILAKNPELIKAIFQRTDEQEHRLKQSERHNLNNILMQLRKCLCHPFIYSKAIEERTEDPDVAHRNLVDAAGKLQLLQLMLPKLQARGHRVLIFSQFLENLDVMEDFLDGLGLPHRRLDGRMTSLEKQKMIDDYNAPNSHYFAFLLSTRSGGVGINLATADTVIIMDPDFNPHQDMQALSRAHRIGQKNKVLVFQLMVRGSAEEKIMQIGKKKMVLDHVLIDRMTAEDDDGQDLESILRHGAKALFDDDDSGDIIYTPESVDKLLDRSKMEQASTANGNGPAFEFSFARVWANEGGILDDQLHVTEEDTSINPDTWEKILQERERAAAEEARKKAEILGRGKRKRANVDYATNEPDPSPEKPRANQQAESDDEFQGEDAAAESDYSLEDAASDPDMPVKKLKIRPFMRVVPPPQPPQEPQPPPPNGVGMDGNVDRNGEPCFVCNRTHPLGSCPLKLAGVEHCGLCGLAHFGHARTCPHLKSEDQISRMIEALKQSTEDRHLVALAKKYCYGIKGDLAQRKRRESGNAADGSVNASPAPTAPQPAGIPRATQPTVDLTGNTANGNGNGQSGPVGAGWSQTNDHEMYSALNNYLSARK
ncbi:putative chromatin remodeling complex subunit (Chd3) [Aspergillus stella-maris]|uniref:putative chromatin remodeling complex subunit (Chd3) n=1 Tax=Aspergillus stella-maris TaxID=1810926 RepID=UPI003CCE2C8D